MKPSKLSENPEDLEVINPENFRPDPSRRQHMEPDLFDKHIPELIIEQEKEIQQSKTVKQDPVRVTINVPLGGPLAGPAAAPPAAPLAPPRVVAPAVTPRTAPVHLPVFDSSSSDEAIPDLFDENSSSDENLADLNLDAEQIARIPVGPLIADEIRQQEPEIHVPHVFTCPTVQTINGTIRC